MNKVKDGYKVVPGSGTDSHNEVMSGCEEDDAQPMVEHPGFAAVKAAYMAAGRVERCHGVYIIYSSAALLMNSLLAVFCADPDDALMCVTSVAAVVIAFGAMAAGCTFSVVRGLEFILEELPGGVGSLDSERVDRIGYSAMAAAAAAVIAAVLGAASLCCFARMGKGFVPTGLMLGGDVLLLVSICLHVSPGSYCARIWDLASRS